ncbi:MAG: hypothetical protein U5J83_16445 [Bryobacterales bacterium]|nr:hypothetical protein [Bryobacterales bacterium]
MNEIRMEAVVAEENLRQALAAVKRNRGALSAGGARGFRFARGNRDWHPFGANAD